MGLTLCVCPDDRGTIVRIGGEIDVCVAETLEEGLLRIMRAHSPRLLIDLSAVTFIDCTGLRALLVTQRRARMRRGSAHLIYASAAVRRIIELTGLRDTLPVHDEGENAMAGAGYGTPTAPARAW